MQTNLVKEQLPQVDKHARDAAQLCQSSNNVPDDLCDCIGELERETCQAASMFNAEQNEQRMLYCVDYLEEL